MGRGTTVALAAAAAAALVLLPMLLVWRPAADTYDQETRRVFVEWKARTRMTCRYAGEEECRYAVFKESRRRRGGLSRARSRHRGGIETRRMFEGWKARYGKAYRDVGEEECRWYRLFKGNRRVVVRLNAADARRNVYGINQFGDLTNWEVRERCYPEMEDLELGARCQAAVLGLSDYERLIPYQVCQCIATDLK